MFEKSAKPADQDSFVTQSAAMQAPARDRMTERRSYVRTPDAAPVHARLWSDGSKHFLNWNGVDLLQIQLNDAADAKPRLHSDGNFQSQPLIQQFVLNPMSPCEARVVFSAPVDMWNMRPRRAVEGEAILGQIGNPLIYGANGMYFPDWDLLLSWHGNQFAWDGDHIEQGVARMAVALDQPWVLLVRPRYYQEHLGFAFHRPWERRPNPKAVSGWCSWEAFHSDVTLGDLRRSARMLMPLVPYGLEYLQLDDGYQNPTVPPEGSSDIPSSWLQTNEKFPGGHTVIIRAAQEVGLRPGIWLNATVNNHGEALEAGCIAQEDGMPLRGDWIQYVLDCNPDTLKRQAKPVYRAFRDAGYAYVKSDSLRHLLYDGLQEAVRFGLLSVSEARERMRAYMLCARAALGEDVYYLSCWGVLSESIGVCDAMRIATDANPRFHAYSMQLREMARWYFANRVMFTVDPDHVCMRGQIEWARTTLTAVSLMGGLLMISDDPANYDEIRLRLIRRSLPALDTRAAECGPVDYTTPACVAIPPHAELKAGASGISHGSLQGELWCTHFSLRGRRWSVLARTAIVALERRLLPLEAIGLDPQLKYACLDLETQGASLAADRLDLPALELGNHHVIALYPVSAGIPCVIGSDRHVSMDAVSILEENWDGSVLRMKLRGFPGLVVRYTLYSPEADFAGCERLDSHFLRLSVSFAANDLSLELVAKPREVIG